MEIFVAVAVIYVAAVAVVDDDAVISLLQLQLTVLLQLLVLLQLSVLLQL